MKSKNRVLFIPLHTPSLLEMMPIAERLVDDGRFEPVFFIYQDIPVDHQTNLLQNQIQVIGPKAITSEKTYERKPTISELKPSKNGWNWFEKLKKSLVRKGLSTFLFSFFWYFFTYWIQQFKARKILEQESVKILILIGDRHVGWETNFTKAANQKGIPSLIVPYGFSDPTGAAEFRLRNTKNLDQYLTKPLSGRLIERNFPNWIFKYGGRDLLFFPLSISLAAKVLGIMPSNPWTIGGGMATRMAVESRRLKNLFIKQRISPEKMIVLGKPSVDMIFEQIQKVDLTDLRNELGIGDDQYVLLCAVPQLAEHNLLSWEEHWREIEFLFDTLTKQPNAVVILSLHPKSDPENYQLLADQYGAVIARKRIYTLLPLCDIFFATYSSTVVQAIGIGKPVIVVDFYGLDYDFYDQEPGVVIIKDKQIFSSTIENILLNRAYYDQLADSQQVRASEWIFLDGQCTKRTVDFIYQMVDE